MLANSHRLCGKRHRHTISAITQKALFPNSIDIAENSSPNGERRASAKRRGRPLGNSRYAYKRLPVLLGLKEIASHG